MKYRWQRLTIFSIFFLIILVIFCFYFFSTNLHVSARNQSIQIAQSKWGISKANYYSEYDRNQRYFAIGGYSKSNSSKYKYIVINGKNGKTTSLNGDPKAPYKSEQIVQSNQKPKKILHVSLGYYHKKPVWEVAYINKNGTLGYYLLNYKNTKIVQTIDNL